MVANVGEWQGPTACVEVTAIRYLSTDPQPGIMLVVLTYADGVEWKLVDKTVIFCEEDITAETSFPFSLEVACTIVEDRGDRVVVSTEEPWSIETRDGVSRLTVQREQVRRD